MSAPALDSTLTFAPSTANALSPRAVLPLLKRVQSYPACLVDEGLDELLAGLHGLLRATVVDWHLHARSPASDVPCVARRSWPPAQDREDLMPHQGWSLRHTEALWHGGEMSFCIRRPRRECAFTAEDTEAVALLMSGLTRWLNWLALSHGPLQPHKALPEHQRKVLLQLSTGRSEKQIADVLGLSPNTTHQYISMLYRRFEVRNRASLMDKWLGGAGQDHFAPPR